MKQWFSITSSPFVRADFFSCMVSMACGTVCAQNEAGSSQLCSTRPLSSVGRRRCHCAFRIRGGGGRTLSGVCFCSCYFPLRGLVSVSTNHEDGTRGLGAQTERRESPYFSGSGRSVAWLARLLGVQEVASSNLAAPTIFKRKSLNALVG